MQHENKLVPATKARNEYLGGISAMTEWRWIRDEILPPPIKINRRNFYRDSDLLAVPQRAAEIEARKEAKKTGEAA